MPVFPYESTWKWYLGGPYAHLVEATEDHLNEFHSPYREVLEDRAQKMKVAMRVRIFFIVLLNISILSAVISWIATLVPAIGEAEAVVSTIARYTSWASAALLGIVFIITRYLGQLESDMLASLALGNPGERVPDPDEEDRVRRQETKSTEAPRAGRGRGTD